MGWPVSHSLSPRIHNHWLSSMGIDGAYVPLAVHPDAAAETIVMAGRMGFRGLNVTVPHKETALRAVESADDLAKRVGAVNTVIYDADGRAHGTNTDGYGFTENIARHPAGRDFGTGPAVVLGAGGAARAIVAALMDAGAPEIRLCNRTRARADDLASALAGPSPSGQTGPGRAVTVVDWKERDGALAGAALLVNATTLGMTGEEPLDIRLDALPQSACVNDVVYAPLETGLLCAARQRGNRAVDGLGMLLHQARPGFRAWFGQMPEVDDGLRSHVLADIMDTADMADTAE